jgi:hypothetical protein
MMPRLHILVLLASSLMLSSCATLFTGVRQKVLIESNPPGAQIYIDGRNEGVTPATLRVNKDFDMVSDNGKDIRLVLEGYEENYFMDAKINPIAILNVTNILFWGIDIITGAVMRFERYYMFEMPLAPTPAKTTPGTAGNNATTDPSDKYDRLKKLKGLYDEGILTQEEYETEKAKILAE